MGKRKLRNCSNCGARHGPPTGKSCAHAKEQESKKVEVASDERGAGAAAMLKESDCDIAVAFASDYEAGGHETDEDCQDLTLSMDGDAPQDDDLHAGRPKSPAGSGAEGARFLRQQMKKMQRERQEMENRIDLRMLHMENVLGRVAGVQQAQLQRLIDLSTRPAETPVKPAKPATEEEVEADDTTKGRAAATGSTKGAEESAFSFKDYSNITVPDEDLEWKDYHGFAAWHLETEKRRKNPFDHQAFMRKGEKISSFEDLMVVTFKTIGKLVELKSEFKGVVSHGLFMSDKASKSVFVNDAFVSYDEDVRKRAGEKGPSAFGVVLQEEVLTNFCLENTKKQRAQAKLQTGSKKAKSDKVCLRYNDAGCTSKSCTYAHKCQSCDGWGHSKKNCGNAEKKKEGK